MKVKAFTLIELLVVIAIIAILAAILFPVFAQAKEASKKIVCLTHSKEMGLAISIYINDSDDVYPHTYVYIGNTGQRMEWAYTLQPYIKNVDMFKCPDDSNPTPPAGTDLSVPALSYIPNYAAMPAYDGGTTVGTAVDAPASVIIIAEKQRQIGTTLLKSYAGTSGFYPDTPNTGGGVSGYGSTDYCQAPLDRVKAAIAKPKDGNYKLARVAFNRHNSGDPFKHTGSSNFIFCDGHAKNLVLEQTLNPSNSLWGTYWYPGNGGTLLTAAQCDAVLPAY